MEVEIEREEGLVVRGRVEIDMRQPFRSVKEAVLLFGERVLAGEVYANMLKQMETRDGENGQYRKKVGNVAAELEETKQSLEKAKEESKFMTYYLTSLRQELKQLKSPRDVHPDHPEIEEVKLIEDLESIQQQDHREQEQDDDSSLVVEFERKSRSVKFASPPQLTEVISVTNKGDMEQDVTPRTTNNPSHPHHHIKKKPKRKPLIRSLIGGIFAKRKGK